MPLPLGTCRWERWYRECWRSLPSLEISAAFGFITVTFKSFTDFEASEISRAETLNSPSLSKAA